MASGKGDRAVLPLLVLVGLRPHEIKSKSLGQRPSAGGSIAGREQLLPMPVDVGAAIAAYLQRRRPGRKDAIYFAVGGADPQTETRCLGTIDHYVLQRAQVDAPHHGSHQFRHTARSGSLREIGEVLRHQSPQSTRSMLGG
jgi:integrase/recombinase XerD